MGLEETFEIISNSKLIPQEHPLFKAFIRSNEQLKTVPDQEKALNFDMDIYFTGRYSRLVKKNLLVSINHKAVSLSFTINQILTDLAKISELKPEVPTLACFLHFFALINSVSKIMTHTF